MKLDLGCGQRVKDGFVGVDLFPALGGIVCDLFHTPWRPNYSYGARLQNGGCPAIEAESVDEVWCSHFVEHVPDLCEFMDELYRVLKPGAIATIRAPYYASIRAFQDPTHVRFITDASFVYFDANWRKREGLDHYPITCDFEQVQVKHWLYPGFEGLADDEIMRRMAREWNVVQDIEFTLRKRVQP